MAGNVPTLSEYILQSKIKRSDLSYCVLDCRCQCMNTQKSEVNLAHVHVFHPRAYKSHQNLQLSVAR